MYFLDTFGKRYECNTEFDAEIVAICIKDTSNPGYYGLIYGRLR